MTSLDRRTVLGGLLGLAGCWSPAPVLPEHTPEQRAQDWLLAQAGPDGRFASTTTGLLGSGQSLTPLVLGVLPRDRWPAGSVDWMLAQLDGGGLGLRSLAVDYPVYATSLLLALLPQDPRLEPCVRWLRTQQYLDGWEGHPAHGGFGIGARRLPTPPHAGHVDLSMARRAIEGLRAAGVPSDDPVLAAARGFVLRCRVDDGFVYSPADDTINKGERPDGRSRAYGSATADGLLALTALGEPLPDGVLAHLRAIHRLDRNPGVPATGPYAVYGEAMRGYYRAASAAVFRVHGGPEGWAEALRAAVLSEQRDDGSWANTRSEQKEDDPLVSTSLALAALRDAI